MNRLIFTRVLTLVAAIVVFGEVGAQHQMLSLPRTQMTVAEAFSQIHSQTDMGVAYSTSLLDPGRTVTFPSLSITVDEAVKTIVEGVEAVHTYEGRMILFSKAPAPKKEPAPVVKRSVG